MRGQEADEEIERAIVYLVQSFVASGDNPKPVVLHSIRVGLDLYNRGYDRRVVIAGLLHDLIEDTAVTKGEIASQFGDGVADIVAATSYDSDIDDYTERYRELLGRCFEMGQEPVLFKAADTLDNSDYYHLGDSEALRKNVMEKMAFFIEGSEPYIGDDPIHQDLQDQYAVVKERIESRE